MVNSKLFSKREFEKLCNSYNSFFDKSFVKDYFERLNSYYLYYRYLVRELDFNSRDAFDFCVGNLEDSAKEDFRNFTDFANLYLSGVILI